MADAYRIQRFLGQLAQITSVPGEITRQTFSGAWEEAACLVTAQMAELDMLPRMDGFGNVIGLYNPGMSTKKPVGIGSHLDTVINGGAYDGAAGIAAALEIVRMFRDSDILPPFPIEVIAFAEEEGGVFGKGCMGSEYVTGASSLETLSGFTDSCGRCPQERAQAVSLAKSCYGEDYAWGRGHFSAFFEIHVEQGRFLEEDGKKIGVVDGVVGILRFETEFRGQPNHAGTTPMSRRQDAAVAMSSYLTRCFQYGLGQDGQIVITNGKLSVSPNLHNVIPGRAAAVTEIRGIRHIQIMEALKQAVRAAQEAGRQYGCQAVCAQPVYVRPKLFDPELLGLAKELGKNRSDVTQLFSWAGHDAKLMAGVTRRRCCLCPAVVG